MSTRVSHGNNLFSDPHLFNVFTSDILKTKNTTLATYTAIFTSDIDSIIASSTLQNQLDLISTCTISWRIEINPEK